MPTPVSMGRVSMVNVLGRVALGGYVSMTKLLGDMGDRLLSGDPPLLGYISIATLRGEILAAEAGNVSMVTCLGDMRPAGCVSKVMVLVGDGDFRLVSMVMGL